MVCGVRSVFGVCVGVVWCGVVCVWSACGVCKRVVYVVCNVCGVCVCVWCEGCGCV